MRKFICVFTIIVDIVSHSAILYVFPHFIVIVIKFWLICMR